MCGYFSRGGEVASNDSGVIENADLHGFWTLHLRHLRKSGQHYYIVLFSPLSPFHWPQNMTLSDLDWLFRAKFCFCAGLAGWDRGTSENNCVKTNKDRHILPAVQIFSMDSSFWWYKVCADIRSLSGERRCALTLVLNNFSWLSKTIA